MEEKYYGILMNRVTIDDGVYVYIPDYIVSGSITTIDFSDEYDEEIYGDFSQKIFVDEMGNQYLFTNDVDTLQEGNKSVCYVISETKLKEAYSGLSLEEAKGEYFDMIMESLHIGILSIEDEENEINIFSLELNNFDNIISQRKEQVNNFGNDYDMDYSDKVFMSIDKLKEIINLNDLDKMKMELNNIYSAYLEIINHFESDYDNSVDGEYVKNLFNACKEHIYSINNIDDMKDTITKIQEIYIEMSILLDEKNIDANGAIQVLNYFEEFISEYDKLLKLDDINDIKGEILKIYEKEEKEINKIATYYDDLNIKKDNDILEKETIDKSTDKNNILNVKEMKEYMDSKIIGQEEAKKDVISAIFMNSLIDDVRSKNSVLLVGPTGSGKTLIAEVLSEYLNKQIEIIDTTQLTKPGYVGANLEDFLERLLSKTKGNLKEAEQSIVVFDEIDKKGSSNDDEVSGKGVLNTLLPFIQGTTYDIKYNNRVFNFDTSKLTIFATGSFAELLRIKNLDDKNSIGFGVVKNISNEDIKYPKLETEDFVKYGNLPAELVGRFSTITQLSGHTKESLRKILVDSDISALKLEKEKLEKLNIELKYNEDYLDNIVNEALKLKTGARSLKATVEKSVKIARWEVIQNFNDYKTIILNGNTVYDNYDVDLVDINDNIINLKGKPKVLRKG